jgi:4-hydroxy-2-oxoglutarate aldolase
VDFKGVIPPLPTPFLDDRLHLAGLRTNIAALLKQPLRGFVVLGSNGEAPQLEDDEADRVIEAAREVVPRERLLVAGTARESTRGTVAATRRAAAAGVDAVLVRTPSFFKGQMTSDVLVDHYRAVADASPVPVLLYNFTAVTGINLQPEAVERLAVHPTIVGIKESGGDIGQIATLVDRTPPGFAVLAGSASTFYPALCVGAIGGILALASVLPELCVRILQLVADGRHEEARAVQRDVMPVARAIGPRFGVPGLKAALDLVGLHGGPPRPPLLPASPSAIEEMRRQLEALHQCR